MIFYVEKIKVIAPPLKIHIINHYLSDISQVTNKEIC